MDKLLLQNIRVYGYHGVYPTENEVGRYFEVDAELYFPFNDPAITDDIKQTVNYDEVYEFIKESFNQNTWKLIETVAVKLAEDILFNFEIKKVIIRVRKLNPLLEGSMTYAEAQVERSRK